MKKYFISCIPSCLTLLLLFSSKAVKAQEHTTYYDQRATLFSVLPVTSNSIIFCGNSITDGGEWQELFQDLHILNRGISGDGIQGVTDRMDEMVRMHPSKLFLLIGVNDLAKGTAVSSIASGIQHFLDDFHRKSPETNLFLQSILPVNPSFNKFSTHVNKTDSVIKLNGILKNYCSKGTAKFVDLFSAFADKEQHLNASLTNDGLHLKGQGYMLWKSIVYPLVYDLAEKPSLLPAPIALQWNNSRFPLFDGIQLQADEIFSRQLDNLKKIMDEKNLDYTKGGNHTISLRLKKNLTGYLSEQSYEITADSFGVVLYASAEQGIYYAIQTLKQLMRDGVYIPGCHITDKPAFAIRGMMHDVGRNYQSIDQLKMQISLLAQYKLNVFHFHLTEDIAWRMESKQYPQLTAAANMLRNAGSYYTIEEVKDLVHFCRERFIILVPEIDMPGHSAAFKRAMGVDMQSAEGLSICKNIINNLCTELDVPYIHIGGDEVKITNKEFLPEIVRTVNRNGKKAIAWDPGGNVPAGTILQMWNGGTTVKKNMPAIDSRHLYVNHHDPIDAVVTVFNHLICDAASGDSNRLGAIACVWPDRRVDDERDILRMNPVFPEMLALAERSWKGGGWKNFLSDIDQPGSDRYLAFTEFENRLLDHQKLYFNKLPFPYVKQSAIRWKFIGPFNNQGNTDSSFYPEKNYLTNSSLLNSTETVYGGTVFIRHFWSPMIGSHLQDVKENTTYYAYTKIYSDYEQEIGMWIGFYNISRSNNTPAPDAGKWDNRNSRIWLNNKEIEPPKWSKPGRINTGMEEPLIDEGYEYRKPTMVTLLKGWNNILIKAPVASFKSTNWQYPVKWMFSCMPVAEKNGVMILPEHIYFEGSKQ